MRETGPRKGQQTVKVREAQEAAAPPQVQVSAAQKAGAHQAQAGEAPCRGRQVGPPPDSPSRCGARLQERGVDLPSHDPATAIVPAYVGVSVIGEQHPPNAACARPERGQHLRALHGSPLPLKNRRKGSRQCLRPAVHGRTGASVPILMRAWAVREARDRQPRRSYCLPAKIILPHPSGGG